MEPGKGRLKTMLSSSTEWLCPGRGCIANGSVNDHCCLVVRTNWRAVEKARTDVKAESLAKKHKSGMR